MVGFFNEAVELRVVGYVLISEAAKIDQSRMGLQETNQGGNGVKTLQRSNHKGTNKRVLTGSISTDATRVFFII